MRIFQACEDKDGIASSYTNIGLVFSGKGDPNQALDYFLKALAISEDKGDQLKIARIHNNIGDVYKALGDYPQALEYLHKSLAIKKQIGDKRGMTTSKIGIGDVLHLQGDHASAQDHYERALRNAEAIGAKRQEMLCHKRLADLHEAMGEFERSLAHYKSFTKMDRSISSEDRNRQLAEIQTKYETEKKEKEAEIYRLRNVELQAAYDKNDELLRNILPGQVVAELSKTASPAPRIVADATIVFVDIVDFTLSSNEYEPEKLLGELSLHFAAFDRIVKQRGLEKLKTFGDGYMFAGGLFADSNQLRACIEAARQFLDFVGTSDWDLRVGIHTGPCIAGLIKGWRMIYDVWGETVNLAARLEEKGEAGRINISRAVCDGLAGSFECESRGEIEAHNIGPTPMYFLGPPIED